MPIRIVNGKGQLFLYHVHVLLLTDTGTLDGEDGRSLLGVSHRQSIIVVSLVLSAGPDA
mgnify:CR=1 FL=1